MSYMNSDLPTTTSKSYLSISKSKEMVNHPSHYQTSSGMEVIDVIEAFNLNFRMGNCAKYILRAGHKDDILQDLKKAKWYLEREIATIEKNRSNASTSA